MVQLDELGCEAIQFRLFGVFNLDKLYSLSNLTNESMLTHVELLVRYNEKIDKDHYLDLLKKNYRIRRIVVFSSKIDEEIYFEHEGILLGDLIYSSQEVLNSSHCGLVSKEMFMVNNQLFGESKEFNSCLNRKLGIDTEGNVKNCPSMTKSFGHADKIKLIEAIFKDGFRDSWKINKDQIEVCKDCEFRYICTDCRAFRARPEDFLSKPLKCNYDPYNAIWN